MQIHSLSCCAGHAGVPFDDSVSPAIKSLMPTVKNPASANDSWEALLPDSREPTKLSNDASSGSLSHLMYLLWPSIPTKTADMLARKFPKVIVNPRPGSCTAAADPHVALDDAAIQAVAPFWQVDDEPEVSAGRIIGHAKDNSQSHQHIDTAMCKATVFALLHTTSLPRVKRCNHSVDLRLKLQSSLYVLCHQLTFSCRGQLSRSLLYHCQSVLG